MLYLLATTKGQFTAVDVDVYDAVGRCWWQAKPMGARTKSFYVSRKICGRDGRRVDEILARRILGLSPGDTREVDHTNHITLDNRRSNLRVVTVRGNAHNRKNQSTHGVGCYYDPRQRAKPWRVMAHINGVFRHLGLFTTLPEARAAHNAWLEESGVV